jgi:pyruvate dehydrogenase E2 component (dihydrolipoyllysine-residue acetyltransferase)
MSYSIVMPQLGLTMTEGAVSEWLKKPGDPVQKYEAIFIVSTEKVEMEVESTVEGTMGEILVQPGEIVPVGATIGYLEGVDQDSLTAVGPTPVRETPPVTNSTHEAPNPLPASSIDSSPKTSTKDGTQPKLSPRAKKLAAELGVGPTGLRGTGEGGRVVEEDVRRAASTGSHVQQQNHRWRLLIAERLTRSIQTIPALSVSAEANAEKLLSIRHHLQPPTNGNPIKLTVTDLLLAIFASGLKVSPDLNATWEKDGPHPQAAVDLGLAVASEQGFVAPVIRNAAELSLAQLLAKRHDLEERGREGKLSLPELEGGIATLSNLGTYRVDQFQALISPGQSCILAVGSIRTRPWVEAALVVKPTVILNLTVDHRLADGNTAATFLNKLIAIIEDPSRLDWQVGPTSALGVDRGGNA